jgi:hypothetical protein
MPPVVNLSISPTIRPIMAACHGSMRGSVGSPRCPAFVSPAIDDGPTGRITHS